MSNNNSKQRCKIISFINHKGGVSKTCSGIHVAYGISKQKKNNKVLIIDLDHQLNMTEFMLNGKSEHYLTIEDTFNNYSLFDKAIQSSRFPNISIIPSSEDIPHIEHKIMSENHPWECLKIMIESSSRIKDFDYVIIDTHPGIYPFVTCALIASTHYVVPLLAECGFSLDGLIKVEKFIENIKDKHNKNLDCLGYLISQFVSKNRMSREYVESIKEHRGNIVFKTIIRRNTHIPIAIASGKVVSQYMPASNGAKDYRDFSAEFIKKLNG